MKEEVKSDSEEDLSLSQLELEEEKKDSFPTNDLEKIINLIEELDKMLILTKMSDTQIQDFVRNNLTKEAKQIKEQYKKLSQTSIYLKQSTKLKTRNILQPSFLFRTASLILLNPIIVA